MPRLSFSKLVTVVALAITSGTLIWIGTGSRGSQEEQSLPVLDVVNVKVAANSKNVTAVSSSSSNSSSSSSSRHEADCSQLSAGGSVGSTAAGVPLLLHFTYRSGTMRRDYAQFLEKCIRLNQQWLPVLWTDADINSLVSTHYRKLAGVFYKFPHKIQRADAMRYMVLYLFGGVYLDLDMECRRPLLASLNNASCFLDRERQHQTQVLHSKQYSAMNSAMGCVPKHPFFLKVIQFVLHPDRLKAGFRFPMTIFDTTGPAMLTRLYQQWVSSKSIPPVVLLNETYFSPVVNPRSSVYSRCRSIVSRKSRISSGSLSAVACKQLADLGYEKSDALFISNRTVAIHRFTHAGYRDDAFAKVDVYSLQNRLCGYRHLVPRFAANASVAV